MNKNLLYESPEVEIIEVSNQDVICSSAAAGGTEDYKDGDTSKWYM